MVSTPDNLLPRVASAVVTQLGYWRRTLALISVAAPKWTIAWIILLVAQGIQPLAAVYLIKLLVDSLVAAANARGDWAHLRNAIIVIALNVAVILLGELLHALSDLVRNMQSELVQDHIKGLVHSQSAEMDLSIHDSSDYQDRLDRARSDAAARPLALVESAGSLVQNGITLIAMAAVLLPFGIWLPLLLLLSTLPAFAVVLVFDRRYHRWWLKRTSDRRWAQYYDLILTHVVTAPELRLFGIAKHFQSSYQHARKLLRTERQSQLWKQSGAKLLASALAQIVTGAALAWMIWRALSGSATLGDLALFYQAFNRGQGLLRSLLSSVGQIYSNSLFLENLFSFLDMRPQIVDPLKPVEPPTRLVSGIKLAGVTFRYPGATKPALENFNLTIPAGKIVAIVGANGAGKSTLLKLLCRFYDPEAGRIEVDGINIRNFAVEKLRRMMTVLFQFPINYQATAANSIALGDLESQPTKMMIEDAARRAGAHDLITGLKDGYDTQLGRSFADGAELSGGEWHRIATARCYLRQSPIILLDEPTSMMDSWSEADWFARFRELAPDHTALVITHRFSVAMRADVIYVMDRGKVVESGTHHELVAAGGLYSQSWTNQMQTNTEDEAMNPQLTGFAQEFQFYSSHGD